MDPTVPNTQWPIDATVVNEAVATISSISEAIVVVVTTP